MGRATVQQQCRRRVAPDRNYYPSTVPIESASNTKPQRWGLSVWAPGLFLGATMLCYLVTGLVCVGVPPQPTTEFGVHTVPATSQCVRVSRHADYVVAEVGIGTPLRIMNLLVNLNAVVNGTALLVHSTRVSESSTVTCEGQICTDVMLLNLDGPASAQQRVIGMFRYANPTTLTSSSSYALGLDGELALNYDKNYFLTSTHLCWESYENAVFPTEEEAPTLLVGIESGELVANASSIAAYGGVLAESPAVQRINQGCGNESNTLISLFPEEAGNEAAWLGLQNSDVYQSAPEDVDARRNVVEVGTDCSPTAYPHAHSLFQLDCLSVYTSCETIASLPFRRAATHQMRFSIPPFGSGLAISVWVADDPRLHDLPKLGDNAVNTAVVKLTLMILSALVIWVRASKVTASHSGLFMFCLRASRCLGSQTEESTKVSRVVIIEDAAIGLLAIGARIAVSVWRLVSLTEDNQLRTPLIQLIACIISFVHWAVRNFVLKHECEVPLTKLGGSTAIIDATSAVMMAFASPPLLVSATGRFDSTARMLVALIVSTITVPRCLFAAACCGVILSFWFEDFLRAKKTPNANTITMLSGGAAKPTKPPHDPPYLIMVFVAALSWLFQAACVGVLMADLFCTPLAFSMHRSATGETLPTAIALFMTTTAVGLPALVKNAVRVAKEAVVVVEGKKN